MKKFLSMALALVMTLSLCTFIAPPEADAAFTDSDELSSKYAQQAADVIQTIEVMDGYDDGTFRPAAGLTRQAAAKIICNMVLGPTTARALPTNANPFPDVLAGNQFSGYISYCSQQNIISGYADGTFRGGDPLSGYAFLKMLLGALGYGQKEEGFVGDNWKVNVAKLALGIGLTKRDVDGSDSDFDGTVQVTREDAAIYAFNTLQADMVEYSATNTLEINGVKVTMGTANATPQTWNTSSTSANFINNATSDGANNRPIVQFAERYFDRLRREPNVWNTYTQDDFGRPSIRWFWKGVEVGTYSRDADVSFVGDVKVNAIYSGLEMTSGDSNAFLYVNSSIPNNERLNVARSNDKDLGDSILKDGNGNSQNVYGDGVRRVDRLGNGTKIECFRNDATNHVDVCIISVYGGKVSAVKPATTKKDAYVVIDVADDLRKRPDTIKNGAGNDEYETSDFMEDDVVAYTYSDSASEIKSMYRMSSASGTLQSRVVEKSVRLDSTTYTYGKEYAFNDITGGEGGLSSKSSYIVYLDENDYVLWVEEDEFAVDQYVLVERISIETTSPSGSKTTTASVIANMESPKDLGNDYANSVALQNAYFQSKDSLGTSAWDARARLRFSNGTVRTVTLDDSKNYRTDAVNDATIMFNATNGIYMDLNNDGLADMNPGPDLILGTADDTPIYGPGYVAAGTNYKHSGTGNGDGNWISDKFTAGNIVRCSNTSGTYKLHAIKTTEAVVVPNFGMNDKAAGRLVGATVTALAYDPTTGALVLPNAAGANAIQIDSETHFAIEDTANSTWKTYIGVKSAPDVSKALGNYYDSTAYIYHRNGVAKLIYITGATISSSANDIVFLAANSTSKLITATDIDDYYTVSAVEKNEIKTIMVKNGTVLDPVAVGNAGQNYQPGVNDNEENCVILNDVSYDSNDLMNRGRFDTTGSAQVYKAQGIRRINSEEVRVNTAPDRTSILRNLDENVHIYFVDGDDITSIISNEIVNDTMDMVYYVLDDGEITYLFIVNYEQAAEEEATATRFYADGEFQLLDPNGLQTHYAYHYMGNNAGLNDVRNNLGSLLGVGLTTRSAVAGEQYIFTSSGVDYTVDLKADAHKVVTGNLLSAGLADNGAGKLTNTVTAAYPANVAAVAGEKQEYVVWNNFVQENSSFIVGTSVKVIITPMATFPTVGGAVTVTVYKADGATVIDTPKVTLETSGDYAGQYVASFDVPDENNFVVTVTVT